MGWARVGCHHDEGGAGPPRRAGGTGRNRGAPGHFNNNAFNRHRPVSEVVSAPRKAKSPHPCRRAHLESCPPDFAPAMHGETRRRNDMTTPVMRTILFAALLLPPLAAAQNAIPTQHNEATVPQLQAQMTAGNLTSAHLTQLYITRILALDQNGPGVNAVIALNPDAITIAKQMDALRRRGVVLGPLHGIPVLLKDNIGTGDKMQTSAGSFALVGRPA